MLWRHSRAWTNLIEMKARIFLLIFIIFYSNLHFLLFTRDDKLSTFMLERQVVGDSGRSWIQKAYERAKEQAEEQGRSLEGVVTERFGVRYFCFAFC